MSYFTGSPKGDCDCSEIIAYVEPSRCLDLWERGLEGGVNEANEDCCALLRTWQAVIFLRGRFLIYQHGR